MAQCTVRTATLIGVEAIPVDAEVDVGAGLPTFAIVGLPDLAVQEARERVRSAVRAVGIRRAERADRRQPRAGPAAQARHRLRPADRARAARGDAAAAARASLRECAAVGELSLDGSVRPVAGHARLRAWPRAAQGCRCSGRPKRGMRSRSKDLDYRPLAHLCAAAGGLPHRAVPARRGAAAPPRDGRTSPTSPGTSSPSARC